MSQLSIVLELMPVALAVVSVVVCTRKLMHDRRKTDRGALILAIISSVLLMVAQLSWWKLFAIRHEYEDTLWANSVWTAFNALVMLTFIRMASIKPIPPCTNNADTCPLAGMDKADRIRIKPECASCSTKPGDL